MCLLSGRAAARWVVLVKSVKMPAQSQRVNHNVVEGDCLYIYYMNKSIESAIQKDDDSNYEKSAFAKRFSFKVCPLLFRLIFTRL